MDRRDFARFLGAGLLGAISFPAHAQTVIDDILTSPKRGNWDDQFDAKPAETSGKVKSTLPIFSPETVSYIERAIDQYRAIVSNGGWSQVPATKKLKIGVSDQAVVALRQRLMVSGDLSKKAGLSPKFDSYVDGAVKRFQARHGFPADGVIGKYSFAALNITAQVRLTQLETNLVRLRSMSGFLGDRYVMVNIPAAQIEAVENGRVAQRHTAIVGKIDRQSPILNSKITNIVVNPFWNAPQSIVQKDIIPLMQKDPNYLTDNSIRIFGPDGQEIDPKNVNWNSDEAVNYRLRQDPGGNSAMSSMKINFPNPHAVYMHDTPKQGLFNNILRFESSGCVRVQNVRDLGTWLLKDTPGWDRKQIENTIATQQDVAVPLANPVPVYFTYITAWSTGDGIVHFRDDIYKRDGVDELSIDSGIGQVL
ncbi:MAG: L,D-transpeptidase family protein [Rhizobiaceae bacterium]